MMSTRYIVHKIEEGKKVKVGFYSEIGEAMGAVSELTEKYPENVYKMTTVRF